jgi:hypothetical protein
VVFSEHSQLWGERRGSADLQNIANLSATFDWLELGC